MQGRAGGRELWEWEKKLFEIGFGKRISQLTRLASHRTLKSSQKLNFKPIVASAEPAPGPAVPAPAVGLWPHLGMCIASSPVELRHLHHMPNSVGEGRRRNSSALWLKCSECCSFLWHGQLAEGFGGKGGARRVSVSQLCLSDIFRLVYATADGLSVCGRDGDTSTRGGQVGDLWILVW